MGNSPDRRQFITGILRSGGAIAAGALASACTPQVPEGSSPSQAAGQPAKDAVVPPKEATVSLNTLHKADFPAKPVAEVVQEEVIEGDKIWLSKTQKELAAIAGSAKKLRTHNDLSVPLTPETLKKDERGITYIRFNAILLEPPQIQELSSVPGYKGSEYKEERYNIRAYTAPILWQHPNGRYAVTRIILGMDGAGDASFKDINRKGVIVAENGVIPFTERGTTVYVRDLVETIRTNAQHIFQVTVEDSGVPSMLKEMFERQKGYGENAGDDSKRLVDLRTRCTASLIQTYGARAIEVVNSSTEREDLQTLPIAGVLAKLTVNKP